jgi:hypothetical protein
MSSRDWQLDNLKLRFWWNFHRTGVSVGAVPKCGNTTIKRAAQAAKRAPRTEFPQLETRYFIVRDPISRFQSFFANKIAQRGIRGTVDYSQYGRTPAEVFRSIVEGKIPSDAHWVPQTVLLGDEKATLVPLKDLSVLTTGYHENATNSEDFRLGNILEGEILKFYRQDALLYQMALQTDISTLKRIV